MSYRDIMVHIDRAPAAPQRIDAAIALSERLACHLVGLFAVADPHVQSMASMHRRPFIEQSAQEAEQSFLGAAQAAGIAAEWRRVLPINAFAVAGSVILAARAADLVILGQHDPNAADNNVPADLIELTVERSGRPVLVIPFAGRFPTIGARVVAAWNGSREATRALHDALPILQRADGVTLLSLRPGGRGQARDQVEPDHLVAHLVRHGARVTVERLVFDARIIDAEERLLSHLADAGADLLVIGAAGRGRGSSRRSLTAGIMARMTVPVLLSA
jgi:nucleotide-binding universal stress UspA family protein